MYLVHSDFLSKCTAACTLEIADVRYILFPLGTPAIRNPDWNHKILKYKLHNKYIEIIFLKTFSFN
jgi:hypothetical protein